MSEKDIPIFKVAENSDNVTPGEEFFSSDYPILKELMTICDEVKKDNSQTKYMEFQKKLNELLADNDFFIRAIKFWNGAFLKEGSLLSKEIQILIQEELIKEENKIQNTDQVAPDINVITDKLTKKSIIYNKLTKTNNIVYSDEFKEIKNKLINFIAQILKETTYTFTENKVKKEEKPFENNDGGIKVIQNDDNYNMEFPVFTVGKGKNKMPNIGVDVFNSLCKQMKRLFGDINDEGLDNLEELKNLTRELFNSIPDNQPKSTYTFSIRPNEIDIEHHLFGDLFMIKSEIPHDFEEILNLDLYRTIIELSICDYMYTTYDDDNLLKILENILKIPLTETLAGYAVLELLIKSNVPLLQQSENKLKIVLDDDPSPGIFPTVFSSLPTMVVSDADHAGHNLFSQFKNTSVELITPKTCPYLSFDAGSPGVGRQFFEYNDRTKHLKKTSGSTRDEVVPPPQKTNVKDLDGEQYLSINNNQRNDGSYEYSLEFYGYQEFNNIVNLLNSDSIKLIGTKSPISNASIKIVTSVVNEVLKRLYLSPKGSQIPNQQFNELNLRNFLIEQVVLYENYVNGISNGRYSANFKSVKSSDSSSKSKSKSSKPISNEPTSSEPTDYDKRRARFICKILLNTISVKSLGDLVPYYLSLIQIMEKEDKPTNTLNFDENQLKNYYTTRASTNDHFIGVVNSGDYSLIQIPLVNLEFLDNDGGTDFTRQQIVDNLELYACVHVYMNDVNPPCSLKAKYITRLIACVTNSNRNVLKYFDYDTIQNVVKDLIDISSNVNFMNITEQMNNIGETNSQIYTFAKTNLIEINPSTDKNIIDECKRLKEILEEYSIQGFNTRLNNQINYYIFELNKNIFGFDLFIDDILRLNNQINQIDVKKFFDDLNKLNNLNNLDNYRNGDDDQKEGSTGNVSLTTINQNVYFLCEYIIRNLNYRLEQANSNEEIKSEMETGDELTSDQVQPIYIPQTISNNGSEMETDDELTSDQVQTISNNGSVIESAMETGDEQTDKKRKGLDELKTQPELRRVRTNNSSKEVGEVEGGNPKKSSKFKVTKKYEKPKKQKKRTRKYVKK